MKSNSIIGNHFIEGEWWYYPPGGGKRTRMKEKICSVCENKYFVTKILDGRCKKCANIGENNPAWKGDKIKQRSGNARALKRFPMKDICEQCINKADVRHHKDEDTANNEPGNILFLCHKCHNEIHKKERDKNGKFVCRA